MNTNDLNNVSHSNDVLHDQLYDDSAYKSNSVSEEHTRNADCAKSQESPTNEEPISLDRNLINCENVNMEVKMDRSSISSNELDIACLKLPTYDEIKRRIIKSSASNIAELDDFNVGPRTDLDIHVHEPLDLDCAKGLEYFM